VAYLLLPLQFFWKYCPNYNPDLSPLTFHIKVVKGPCYCCHVWALVGP
jgi:hypothetical protein